MDAGSRLGPYEIISVLGAGGMGEVYRARDVRVGRDVAIKILPIDLASDPDRLARFEQEARATASLNHPNLLTIHDLGMVGERPYLVFELLEGRTLRELIAEGHPESLPKGTEPSISRLTVRKSIRYGIQLASGLGAAHDRGVIHRDLKPENIFVTNDGHLKILDFGLAVTRGMFDSGFDEADTMQRFTDPGVVMGTVGYMSPEQVRGKEIDSRSDIFSFGVILCEMIVGQRPFQGESAADVMSSILNSDPAGIDEVAPGLRAIIERCLEKNREERFRSAHDLALALEAVSGSSRSVPIGAVEDRPDRSWRSYGIGILLLLASLVGFFIGKGISRDRIGPEHTPVMYQLTYRAGSEWHPSIAPDAGSFIFVSDVSGNDDIWLQRVGGENAINLTPESDLGDTHPAYSPDGKQIAFRSERAGGGIWVMGATGESARRLTEFGFNPSWSPDSRSLVIATEGVGDPSIRNSSSGLWRVHAVTGESTQIETGMDAVQPSWSPDGRWITFWGLPAGTGKRVIAVVPADGGTARVIVDDDNVNWNPVWSPEGTFIYFASDRGGAMNLWKIPIESETGLAAGEAMRVTTAGQWNGQLSVASDTGSIAYVVVNQRSSIDQLPFDPEVGVTGEAETAISTSRDIWSVHPSPSGESIAFKAVDRHEDLFLAGKDGSRIRRLTDDRFKDRWPSWSPSGDRLYFFSDRTGGYEIWSIRPDGSGLTRETWSSGEGPVYPEPSPDGNTLVGTYFSAGEMRNAFFDLKARPDMRLPQFLQPIDSEREMFNPRWSPDGRYLSGPARLDGGAIEPGVWIHEVDSGRYRQISDEGSMIAWISPDRILMRIGSDLFTIDPESGDRGEIGSVPEGYLSFAVSSDLQSIYGVENEIQTDIWMIEPVR